MSVYSYSKYKILISPESKKTQGLQVGDVVRRQYFDPSRPVYSLMAVLETGTDIIGENESHYFIGALLEGDEPKTGELLDFVRVTNLFDSGRSGALYLTASDSEAPYMDVIDGMTTEKSLCYPAMDGGKADIPGKNKYAVTGKEYLDTVYTETGQESNRIFRITRNAISKPEAIKTGLKQTIEKEVSHPQKLLISCKIRASKSMENVPVSFGYTSGEETDGAATIHITEEWKYVLHIITVDYPAQYRRSFSIDLTAHLLLENDWAEIADLNIMLQADIANFSGASKVRIGKVKGIIDPVFGVLDGYGAYFQNLYATKNVNIAGTLTAGDENGFSSTFYVGKIHKNVILNSIANAMLDKIPETTPAGMGDAWQMGLSAEIKVQSSQWRDAREGLEYCFSLWLKAERDTVLSLFQNEHFIGNIMVDSREWKRYRLAFRIKSSNAPDMLIRMKSPAAGLYLTSPQLEAGTTPSQYQPTDGTLSYVEDYGAWFSKGGIGGTIQNPLLKLNEDGSISSRDSSFVIHPDGTGHFASGRFKWTKDTIVLQDVTIRWEDFDEAAQENMLPKSVSLKGTDVFHYPDELENACEPAEIIIYAAEHNFTASSRTWQYLNAASVWKNMQGENRDFLKILPDGHYWEERKVLSVKYIAACEDKQYEEIFTVRKQFDGQDSYSIYIASTAGTVFKNGIVGTTLVAKVMKGGEDVTDKIPEYNFRWKRTGGNPESDTLWNSAEHRGKTLEITGDDVYRKAVFDCEVIISA